MGRGHDFATRVIIVFGQHWIGFVDMHGFGGQFQGAERILFGAGAVSASFVWFLVLSLGAGLLAPLFTRSAAWRILDTVVGLVMWLVAISLLWGDLV